MACTSFVKEILPTDLGVVRDTRWVSTVPHMSHKRCGLRAVSRGHDGHEDWAGTMRRCNLLHSAHFNMQQRSHRIFPFPYSWAKGLYIQAMKK